MGTLSLVFGIILIVIGIIFLTLTLMSPAPDDILLTILFEAILIAGGTYLIRRYDDDKEKKKSENSSQVIHEETQFWVCPHCGGDTQAKNEKQFCSKCNVYL